MRRPEQKVILKQGPSALQRARPDRTELAERRTPGKGHLMYIWRARTGLSGRHAMVQNMRRFNRLWISLAVVLCFAFGAAAQVSPDLFSGLQWRNVGPYHGGRIASVTGVIGEPGTF